MKKFFNGNSLKFARQYRGFSVDELADKVKLSRQQIFRYEGEENENPGLDKIIEFSKVLEFPIEFFYSNNIDAIKVSNTYFRALLGSSKKEKISQVNRAIIVSSIYKVLKQYVNFPKLNIPKESEIKSDEDIKQKANELREVWKIKNRPVDDIVYLMESNGILVNTVSTDEEGIDAYTQYTTIGEDEIMCVTLENEKTSAARLQFSAAHELGHILIHGHYIDVNNVERAEFREIERQANLFAAELLLPENEFKKDLLYPINLKSYEIMKRKWKVSIGAMMMRALNLEMITKNQYQYLIKQYNTKQYRKNEPLDDIIAIPKPQVLKRATEMLLIENVFEPEEFVMEVQNEGIYIDYKELEKIIGLEAGTLATKEKGNIIEFEIIKDKNK